MLVDRLLIETADRFPEKIAIVHGDTRARYAEILTRSVRFASVLKEYGLQKGDRVVIALENSFDYIVAYFGVLYSGGVCVSINPQTNPAGLLKIAYDCGPVGFITGASSLHNFVRNPVLDRFRFIICTCKDSMQLSGGPTAASFEECCSQGSGHVSAGARTDTDLASIIYTSGTTGHPKGVMLSHKNLIANTRSIVSYLSLSENDSIMVVLPFYYSYGNSLLLTHFMQGGTLVVEKSFLYPNAVLERMVGEQVTGFAGVPSTFAILCHRSNFHNTELPSLRYITQAGGPMPHIMATEILKVHPHVKFYIMYGQTEASARLSYLPPEDLNRKYGSIGKAIPGVTLTVLNENGERVKPGETGEIIASGDNIMMGYWGSPDDTGNVLRDGKLYTGDMATVDEDGYIYIVSRKKDMIKSGAHRVAPREIEEVILEHAAVFEVAVVGKQDALLGESIFAYVVLKDGLSCTQDDILHLCRKSLPLYKMPKTIHFVASLPKTESGKIKKEELKKHNPIEVRQ